MRKCRRADAGRRSYRDTRLHLDRSGLEAHPGLPACTDARYSCERRLIEVLIKDAAEIPAIDRVEQRNRADNRNASVPFNGLAVIRAFPSDHDDTRQRYSRTT